MGLVHNRAPPGWGILGKFVQTIDCMKKKRLLIAGLLAGCMILCNQTGHAQTGRSPREIAFAWLKSLNQHDTVTLATLYADNAQILSPNWEGARVGPAAVREIYGRYFTGTPDLEQQLTHLIATDSALVIEYISRGTFQNPEKGTPPYMKGKKYELQNCTRLDINHGKIQQQVNYFDQVAFLKQVGFFDQPGK